VTTEAIRVVVKAIDDDVMIILPDEFGFQPGDEFEVTRRDDGVVVLTCSEKADAE
jgi:hypothetical protein